MGKTSNPWEDLLLRHDAVLQFVRQAPLLLGGTSGSAGGSGSPVGGFVGQLPQRRVAGDTSEVALFTSGSIGSLLDNLNNIRYWLLPAHNFQASTGSPPTNYLTISSGSWHKTSGEAPLTFTGGNSPPLVAPTSGSRYNLLTINTSGVLSWTHGSDGDPPAMLTFPSPTSGSMPLWLVLGRSSGSVIRFYDDGISHYLFRDVRPFLDWGIGGAGSSGSSPQPGGRVIYTDSNGAPVADPNFLFDTSTDTLTVQTDSVDGLAIIGYATAVGGIGIYGQSDTHEGFGLYGLGGQDSTSGSALYAEGGLGGAARILTAGALPTTTTDNTANVVEIERAIHLATPAPVTNVTGALLDLYDNVGRDGGVGGTTSGSLIHGRVDLSETFEGGTPTTVFSVTRAGHIVTSGSVNIQGFAMPVGATSGYVLTTDANGVGTWQVTGASSGSSPQPAGRVVFTDTNGAAITDSTFLWDNTNKQLQLEATGSNAGIRIGGDVQLYRHALDIWRTADNIIVDRGIDVGIVGTPQTGEVRVITALKMMTDGVGGGFFAGASSDVQFYRGAANLWQTPDSVTIDLGLNIGSASGAATGEARASVGFAARADGSGAGFWAGAASDVQLYRSVADMWRTPDSLTVDGNLLVGNPLVTIAGISIGKTVPTILLDETDATANNRLWETFVNGEQLILRAVNDAYTVAGNWCYVDRTGTTIDLVTFPGTAVKVDGLLGVGVAPSAILHVKAASPIVRIAGTVTNQALKIDFYDNDTTLKSQVLYAGPNGAGDRYFGILDYASDYLALVQVQNKDIRFFTNSVDRGRMDGSGNFVWNTAALATTATNGFIYVPSCAGTPTGTPTTYTGRVPIVVDTSANKLYFYSNGAWRDAGP